MESATNSSATAVTTATSPIVIGSSTSAKPTATPAAEATMAPATTSSKIDESCTSRDPFVGLPGLIGECVNGRWVSVPGVSTTGTVYLFDIDGAFWGILGDDGKVYRPMGGLPQNLQKARARVSFEGKFVGEVASPDRVVLIDVRKVTAR